VRLALSRALPHRTQRPRLPRGAEARPARAVDLGFLPGYPPAEDAPHAAPPAPRPPAGPGAPPLRVALVTLCDGALADICAASVDNKRAYAERHGA
jgi:hypothetical protein